MAKDCLIHGAGRIVRTSHRSPALTPRSFAGPRPVDLTRYSVLWALVPSALGRPMKVNINVTIFCSSEG
ncbi:hypothetical protein N7501_003031 [Penicillium viridicatum]|nr:hypothetical protein N7501_003031 [Penicillium viridicatum]